MIEYSLKQNKDELFYPFYLNWELMLRAIQTLLRVTQQVCGMSRLYLRAG